MNPSRKQFQNYGASPQTGPIRILGDGVADSKASNTDGKAGGDFCGHSVVPEIMGSQRALKGMERHLNLTNQLPHGQPPESRIPAMQKSRGRRRWAFPNSFSLSFTHSLTLSLTMQEPSEFPRH